MQVSIETIGSLGRRLTVAVPADAVEKEFSVRLKRLSKQVKLPGFRPGKVPLKMVEAQYGGKLMQEIAGDLIKTTLQEAIGRQGLRPADGPRVQHKPLGRGQQLEYTAEFDIYPEIKHTDLAGAHIDRPTVVVTADDVDRTIETIRRQRVRWNPVVREARQGDRLTLDFTGYMQGKAFDGGKAENYLLVLGSGSLIEGLEQGLLGATSGQTQKISVTFPSNYHRVALAGQPAEFDIKVNEVAEPVLPEIDESLAKELGIKDGDINKLRQEVQANLEREAASRSRAVVRSRALKLLLDANPIDLPQSLIDAEMQRLVREASGSGKPPEDETVYRARAHRRVALGLILGDIVRIRSIVPDPGQVRVRLEEMASEYESPQEFIQWHYSNPERLQGIESLIMEEKVVEELLVTANVSDKALTFQELLALDGAAA